MSSGREFVGDQRLSVEKIDSLFLLQLQEDELSSICSNNVANLAKLIKTMISLMYLNISTPLNFREFLIIMELMLSSFHSFGLAKANAI